MSVGLVLWQTPNTYEKILSNLVGITTLILDGSQMPSFDYGLGDERVTTIGDLVSYRSYYLTL
jgi:hypothetical protein